MRRLPYGTWPSDLSAEAVGGSAGMRFSGLQLTPERLRWRESRPAERGRCVVVELDLADPEAVPRDVTPEEFNVRTRVHEYGGGECWYDGDRVFFSDFSDGRLYRLDGAGSAPVALTAAPSPHAVRYADGCVTPGGEALYCVRERHDTREVVNELVRLATDGSCVERTVVSGPDFVAAPRLDPSGTRLAWLSWDHPRMPWDGTELWVADVGGDGSLGEARLVAGGPSESIVQPEWSADGVLHFCTDRSGWWNLARESAPGAVEPLTELTDAEIGHPAWGFAMRSYAFLGDGRIVCRVTRAAVDTLALLLSARGPLVPIAEGWTVCSPSALAAAPGTVAFGGSSPLRPLTLVVLDLETETERVARRSLDVELDAAAVSIPRAIEFTTDDGDVAHAFYYPPASATVEVPGDERPPLRVVCHGGPTAHSAPHLDLDVQYFTQRGIGVVDVNYRGSSGYGRAFRRLLDGRWGDADWRDCVAAARHLAAEGAADPARTWVEGGSAGGYVVFCALVFEPSSFAAGVSYFGVSDVAALARDTHKFESHYLDTLVAPYPEREDVYRERSPIHEADRLERPLLLLQGLDDEVVPPSQAELMVEVLQRKGIPHAYLAFEGEGHGFRRLENIRRSLEATLSFVGQVFGFEPADELAPLELGATPAR